jgi:hypothetical protein
MTHLRVLGSVVLAAVLSGCGGGDGTAGTSTAGAFWPYTPVVFTTQ